MGVYLYTLRAGRAFKTPQGNVLPYAYSTRLAYGWDEEQRQKRMVEQHEERVANLGLSDVLVTTVEEAKHRDGAAVYRSPTPVAIWYDCDDPVRYLGPLVGCLRRQPRNRRRWRVLTLAEEAALTRARLATYARREGLDVFLSEHGDAPMKQLARLLYDHWCAPRYKLREGGGRYLDMTASTDQERTDSAMLEHAMWLGRVVPQEAVRRLGAERTTP